ncbi:alpha-L-rhamnosidase [Flavobacterium sp. HJJ]|uniref:alpha-L-rhamnosidase n=1 Tax=Flavobacterium sp. HJJ TaxID=2783792 RepID=UPI00188AF05E|nr:alpha-L-rhamnosidase [Flavobacterium sp. HJJ]MBF4473033.1 family 78 glycoside hydrolase catalytic domain [Flavobacterium sp. HJJ]
MAFFILLSLLQVRGSNSTVPAKLRCNYLVNPIGIGNSHPNLSWQTNASEENWLQTAYQIIVATSPKHLTEKECDVWNSGKILDGESVSIPYAGPKMKSQKRYYWAVRVWDNKGKVSLWSAAAFWEMGILNNSEWTAKWISFTDKKTISDRENVCWVWLSDQDALDVPSKTKAWFRLKVNFNELPKIASLQTVVRGDYQLFVNGKLVVAKTKAWQTFERQEILGYLHKGENNIDVKVSAVRTSSFSPSTGKALAGNYATFAALFKVVDAKGTITKFKTSDGKWLARNDNNSEWKLPKVVGELNDPNFGLDPGPLVESASMFRKELNVKKDIASARLYVSALGSYCVYVNGQRVSNAVLTPEFTNYNSRITYQTYDIASLLKKGQNAIGSLLGDGWFGSPMGWNGEYDLYGPAANKLFAEIHLKYTDGTTEKIITDQTWKADASPILLSEIYAGEFYDARFEQSGWNKVGFNDKNWNTVKEEKGNNNFLSAQVNNPVKVTMKVKPVAIHKTPSGNWIIDMGQNLVGWLQLKVKGSSGTVVRMRFAEKLSNKDSIYVDNLRNATATDNYVLKGKVDEVFTPHFTFHGFRYIEVSGYPGQLTNDNIVAEVISSVEDVTGVVETSNPLINKMYSLGIWGQRSNFISVPTDCPQRDERMGYTGDGQVFWRTGTYNFDIAAFTHKWLKDIVDEQTVEGGFTNTAPAVPKNNRKSGSPGWEDAGVIVPWNSWMQYGDKGLIEENWNAMVRYMDYVAAKSNQYIRPGGYLGDWLAPDGTTNNDLISTGLWGMTAKMMAQMATTTNRNEEAKKYLELADKIKAAFQKQFIAADGKVGTGSQTSYVIALHTGMVPESLQKVVTDKLVQSIEAHDGHLTTGFLGTPYLLFALSENGRADVAYRLLLNETYPSWGYMVKNGATTWWERWNSDKSDPTMNSYNHYAFGSVVEWVYRSMAGINADPTAPGFKKTIISPTIDTTGKITDAKGRYNSVYGEITSEWKIISDHKATLKVKVPANTTAKIILPNSMNLTEVVIGGGSSSATSEKEVGSGSHQFEVKW